MKKSFPLLVFFSVAIFAAMSCQNQDSSSATGADTTTSESKADSIPTSTKVDNNWVRTLQGVWTLKSNAMSTLEISGNTYKDKMDGTTNGEFKIEYSGTCKKCKTDLNLTQNKCMVLFNKEDETVTSCVLIQELNAGTLKIININKPEVVYEYSRSQ